MAYNTFFSYTYLLSLYIFFPVRYMEILPILKAFKLLSSFKNSFWITLPDQLHCWKVFHPVCDRSSVLLILYFEEYKFLISSPHTACTSLANSPVAHCTGDESETQVGHILCPGHPVRHCLRQVLSSIHWIPKIKPCLLHGRVILSVPGGWRYG